MKQVYIGCFAAIVVIIALAFFRDHQIDKWSHECEARGGRLVHLNDGHECFDRSIFR